MFWVTAGQKIHWKGFCKLGGTRQVSTSGFKRLPKCKTKRVLKMSGWNWQSTQCRLVLTIIKWLLFESTSCSFETLADGWKVQTVRKLEIKGLTKVD